MGGRELGERNLRKSSCRSYSTLLGLGTGDVLHASRRRWRVGRLSKTDRGLDGGVGAYSSVILVLDGRLCGRREDGREHEEPGTIKRWIEVGVDQRMEGGRDKQEGCGREEVVGRGKLKKGRARASETLMVTVPGVPNSS